MIGGRGARRAAPWALCAVSLVLLGLGNVLRWVTGERTSAGQGTWLDGTIEALGFAGIPVVGAVLASRLPRNLYGWLWCVAGLVAGIVGAARPLVTLAGGPAWVAWLLEGYGFITLVALLTHVFLLFPTGRLPTARWRWVSRATVAAWGVLALAFPFVRDPAAPEAAAPWALPGAAGRHLWWALEMGVEVMFAVALAGMVSPVLRFRRAAAVERRQLAWFLYATVLNATVLLLDVFGLVPSNLIGTAVSAATFALLPVAVAVAVLRYRLYEIDRIVSRTVTYGTLTAAIFAVYLLVVAVLPQLGLPAGSSDAVVAAATLAVAAVVARVRRRLQAAVDRRFDRARYDAQRAVETFAARLREQVDLDEVVDGLRGTVTATVAPTHVGVWLRIPPRAVEAGS